MTTTMSSAVSKPNEYWIQFNIDDIKDLKYCYEETIKSLLNDLPSVNWNSRLEVKDYFKHEHNLQLHSLKIEELKDHLSRCEEDCFSSFDLIDDLTGLIEYLKLSYYLKNYIGCILRHEKDGTVYLREINGELKLPNKRPLPYAPELTEAIVASNIERSFTWEQ